MSVRASERGWRLVCGEMFTFRGLKLKLDYLRTFKQREYSSCGIKCFANEVVVVTNVKMFSNVERGES